MLIARVFGVGAAAVEAHLLLSMSIVAEAISSAFFLIFGLLTGRRVFSYEEIMLAMNQYNAMQLQQQEQNAALSARIAAPAIPSPENFA